IVRSVRGAGGGYNLARPPQRITVGDIVRAVLRNDRLFSACSETETPDVNAPGVAWIVRTFEEGIEACLEKQLSSCTLAELAQRKLELDDSLSIMPGI
ncbi:MAG TPA: Rrf2 family transcriptional regulator, partial [Chthonomonadales bacterium]|nr:Rrf2 family transcriptional regulator [Chthonomonadales bacterium]